MESDVEGNEMENVSLSLSLSMLNQVARLERTNDGCSVMRAFSLTAASSLLGNCFGSGSPSRGVIDIRAVMIPGLESAESNFGADSTPGADSTLK